MKIIQILSSAAAVLVLGACSKHEKQAVSMPPTPAQLTKAVSKEIRTYLDTLGTTSSLSSVNIVPQVSGQIVEVRFKQGDIVKKGDILAIIDKRPYEAAVMQAEGNLAQAYAQLKIDQLNVERNKTLAAGGYVDKQTYDGMVAKVDVDKGVIETCTGALDNAKINLGWCDIKAPTDGKVGLYNINAGNVVSAGTSVITTIEFVDSLFVDFVIPSQYLYDAMALMKKNGGFLDVKVTYIEDNLRDRAREAKVKIVLNKIRYETGTAVLRGELDNSDHLFWPDQPVRVVVYMSEPRHGVLIPEVAFQTNNAGPYVYTATPFKDGVLIVKQVQVKKGQLYDKNLMLVDGVNAGEYVVERVSQLRLQAGPFVYMADKNGHVIGADGKVITTAAGMQKFMADTAKICDALRAEMMKKAAQAQQNGAAKQPAAKEQSGKEQPAPTAAK